MNLFNFSHFYLWPESTQVPRFLSLNITNTESFKKMQKHSKILGSQTDDIKGQSLRLGSWSRMEVDWTGTKSGTYNKCFEFAEMCFV